MPARKRWRSIRGLCATAGKRLTSIPELGIFKCVHVMDGIVAIIGHAGEPVRLDVRHHLRRLAVLFVSFERSRPEMTVEAFAVVVRVIQLYVLGLGDCAE